MIKHVDLDKSQHLYTVDYFCSTDAPKTKDWTVEVRPRRDKQIGGNGSSLTTLSHASKTSSNIVFKQAVMI